MKKIKPFKGFGCSPLHTDGDGRIIYVTKEACMKRLREHVKRYNYGCKNLFIVDCGDYWKWAAC